MKNTSEILRGGFPAVNVFGSIYVPGYIKDGDTGAVTAIKEELLKLDWQTKRTARHEYFMAAKQRTYSYGNRGTGDETYQSQPFSFLVRALLLLINHDLHTELNVCFLNKYDDEKQHLGWHADNFPDMRKDQPIVVVSFGAEREIWMKDKRGFTCDECCKDQPGIHKSVDQMCQGEVARDGLPVCHICDGTNFTSAPPKGRQPAEQKQLLEEGSMFIMPAGYQDTHLHRIPKHDRPCGYRISLTFRSFAS